MNSNDSKGFHELKLVVIGTAGTGKTSFVQKWTKGVFEGTYKATIVTEFGAKIYEYNERKYRVQIWDIGGQDRNKNVAQIFAKDSHGCIILSSCDAPETLIDSGKWKRTIEDSSGQIPCLLIENKCDLLSEEEKNNTIKLNETVNEFGFIKGFKTSAKNDINITESIEFLLRHIIEAIQRDGDKIKQTKEERQSIKVGEQTQINDKQCCK